ncbi:MAG: NADH:flavin oxidoreductase [Candidatus Heimdallarchaeota archaeon]|nr:MAG: NADH:flavin oxidoreductase [Candidatus Heimdallarchaeota archaeon]
MFNPGNIGELKLQNRFIRSATAEFIANDEDGTITEEYYPLYSNLGLGEIGLIIQGHLYVMDEGKAHTHMAGIANDMQIDGLKKITKLVHEADKRNLIAAQLNHGGANSVSTKTASAREDKGVKVMSGEDIENVIKGFGAAALRVKKAGYDAVQIHSAHGYLLSQFLSTKTNKRTDSWGGSLENRARFLLTVYHAIRAAVGPNYPVLVKMNGSDDPLEGFTVEEGAKVASWLANEGLDAIEVSGMKSTRPVKKANEGYFVATGRRISHHIGDMPLILVGGLRSQTQIQELHDEFADFISLCRPFIREPDLVQKFRSGKKRADCISCNRCFKERIVTKCFELED